MSKTKQIMKFVLPLMLGGAILYWMYRDFDFQQIKHVLLHEMDWTWMLLSFPFGIMAQVLRGWRWRQTLEGIENGGTGVRGYEGTKARGYEGKEVRGYEDTRIRRKVLVNSIFLSYAASLVIPRIGEFTRCGVLKRWEGISFTKALGTVVTERAIDSLLMLSIAGMTVALEMSTFGTFFEQTGTSLNSILSRFTTAGYIVTAICIVAMGILLHLLLRHLYIYNKVRTTLGGLWEGISSLKNVKSVPLFAAMTIGIWVCYFLHYYLTFFCFDFTADLGARCALVTFIVGSIAVIVPTPNGAGPWHFAVKTMLILYGVADHQALYFVLIVHTVQTMLVVGLGIYAWLRLTFVHRSSEVRGTKVRRYGGTEVRGNEDRPIAEK